LPILIGYALVDTDADKTEKDSCVQIKTKLVYLVKLLVTLLKFSPKVLSKQSENWAYRIRWLPCQEITQTPILGD
jgi:hypothetical protein